MLSSMPEGPVFQNPFAVASLSSSPPVNDAPSASSVYSSCPNATEREKMHRKHSTLARTTARCLPRDFFRVVVVVIFESFVVLDAFQNEDAKVEREKRNKRSDTRLPISIYLSIYLSSRRVVSFFLSLFSRALTRAIVIVIVP